MDNETKSFMFDTNNSELLPSSETENSYNHGDPETTFFEETLLYQGNVVIINNDFSFDHDVTGNLIIDGDLIVEGQINIYAFTYILVTGNVYCKNLVLSGECFEFCVRGNLTVENGILARYGDDGNSVRVSGQTDTKLIVSCDYAAMYFKNLNSSTVVLGNSVFDNTELRVNFKHDALEDVLLPKFLDEDGHVCFEIMKQAMIDGEQLFYEGVLKRVGWAKSSA